MAQTQCPNCGGYRISSQNSQSWRDVPAQRPLSQDEIRAFARRWNLIVGPLLTIALALPVGILLFIVWAIASGTNVLGQDLGLGPGFFLTLAACCITMAIIWVRRCVQALQNARINYNERRLVGEPGTDHRCDLCGYSWHLAPGQNSPPVTLRPVVISTGAARLRAEEAAARAETARIQKEEEEQAAARRKRDLEWNHWNIWNNPDNS